MAVYVDQPIWKLGRMIMCHMMADSLEELHNMADQIGIKRKYFQTSNSGVPHYDISKSKRKLAINYGAIPIGKRDTVQIIKEWRKRIGGSDE